MYPQGSLSVPGTVAALEARLARLTPTAARQWGRMTPQQMLCHLADSFDVVSGDRPAKAVDTWFMRTVGKVVALRSPMPWPKGVPTGESVDAEKGGTPPSDFEADRARVVRLLRAFVAPGARRVNHPAFGAMSDADWMRWGFGHLDHHLRQFGL
jgi:hypothetical protein